MVKEYTYSKLKGRIVEKYGSQKAFCKAIQRPENTVSRKLNNFIAFSQEDINEWAKALDIDVSEYGVYFFS